MNKNNIFKFYKIVILMILSFLYLKCSSETVHLDPITDYKRPTAKKIPDVKAKVTEVEEIRGEQKYIFIKYGSMERNPFYRIGVRGIIFNDLQMSKNIGKFKVIKIYSSYSKCEVTELTDSIEPKAIAIVELGYLKED